MEWQYLCAHCHHAEHQRNNHLQGDRQHSEKAKVLLGHDSKKYYQATDAKKMQNCEVATISVTCHDGAKLGEGSTQYKCSSCGGSVNEHTKQCAMATSVTETSVNTSELDGKISECESQISMIQAQIDALEAENADLIKKIASSSVEDAATYRQQYNANKNRISSLTSDKNSWQNQLIQYQQAKQEAQEGESVSTDDYYRIPAIMQDCKSAFNLSWNDGGSWNGNTFVRTATMPNIKLPPCRTSMEQSPSRRLSA